MDAALNIVIYVLLAGAAIYAAAWIAPVLYARLVYPGPLEHQEEIFLNTLRFLGAGGNIYQTPDLRFAGVIYPPFYFFAARPFVALFGLNFFALRLFSLLAIAAGAACVYFMLRRQDASIGASLVWLPLYLVVWPFYGWIDIGRLEALFMLLILAGICLYVCARGRIRMYALAGGCLGLAAATKQTGLIFLPVLALMMTFDRRAVYALGGMLLTAGAVYGAGFLMFGWGMYEWVFVVPSHHNEDFKVGFNLLRLWISQCAGIAILLPLFLFGVFKAEGDKSFAVLIMAGCVMALPPMFKEGAAPMDIALLNAFCLVAGGYACAAALRRGIGWKIWVLAGLGWMVFSACESNIGGYMRLRTPRPEDAARFNNLVDFVNREPGQVWLVSHPWVNNLAGKEIFVPMQQLGGEWDGGQPGAALPADVAAAIAQQKFSRIIMGQEYVAPWIWDDFMKLIREHYRYAGKLPQGMGIARIDGLPMFPISVWVPK